MTLADAEVAAKVAAAVDKAKDDRKKATAVEKAKDDRCSREGCRCGEGGG
jgi:hypothetical protein